MPGTITVTVRDRSAESPWGVGRTNPVVRPIVISALCPPCGGPRGQRRTLRQHEDGVTFYVDTWTNPCGHVDLYEAVVREAARIIRRTRRSGVLPYLWASEPDAVTRHALKFPPSGCQHCALGERFHFTSYTGTDGPHVYTAPTSAQIKERMLARRAARPDSTTTGQEPHPMTKQHSTDADRA
ncbi:hypothetical protein GCM10022221_67910 [Actinocorallia aurea]